MASDRFDSPRLLVVDDDSNVREAVSRALRLEGYTVIQAEDGARALTAMAAESPDAVVLDLLMPYLNGFEVCRRLRSAGDRTPILVLTARDSVDDRVAGLDAGADDYLAKPFALAELLARLRALLRRVADPETSGPLRFGDLVVDPDTRSARRGDRPIDLTRTEFALLELLARNAGRVLTREVLLDRIWGYDCEPGSNSLEVFVGYLRRKTEAAGEPRLVHTVRGVGYLLRNAA
jgi:two-component system response regulator MprA